MEQGSLDALANWRKDEYVSAEDLNDYFDEELQKFTNSPASSKQVGGDWYKDMAIEPLYFAEMNGLSPCESKAIKYICRHRKKGGVEDINKAIHALELLKEYTYEGIPD